MELSNRSSTSAQTTQYSIRKFQCHISKYLLSMLKSINLNSRQIQTFN